MHLPAKANSFSVQTFMANQTHSDSSSICHISPICFSQIENILIYKRVFFIVYGTHWNVFIRCTFLALPPSTSFSFYLFFLCLTDWVPCMAAMCQVFSRMKGFLCFSLCWLNKLPVMSGSDHSLSTEGRDEGGGTDRKLWKGEIVRENHCMRKKDKDREWNPAIPIAPTAIPVLWNNNFWNGKFKWKN